MKEKPFELNYYPQLKALIASLTIEQKQVVLENLHMGKLGTKSEIFFNVRVLIEDHKIIFDGKESLFFKKTGKQILIKHD